MSVDSEAVGTNGHLGLRSKYQDLRVWRGAHVLAAMGFYFGLAGAASSEVSTVAVRPGTNSGIQSARVRVAELREVLRQPMDWSERNALFRSLSHLVSRRNAKPHLAAIRELSWIELPSAAEALGIALRDTDSPHRKEAAMALLRVRRVEALPVLLETLHDPNPDLRSIVAGTIGDLVGQEDLHFDAKDVRAAETALARMLASDSDPRVRLAALDGLTLLGSEEAVYSAFTVGSKDPDEFVECGLVARSRYLVKGGKEARINVRMIREFLRDKLSEESRVPSTGILKRAYYAQKYYSPISKQRACVDVEATAASVLAILRDRAALTNLLRTASNDVASLRASAASALANYKDDEALASIRHALVDPVRGVRQAAIIGLGESHDPRADQLLIFTLQESTPVDRRDAAKALGGSFGASSALIRAFADRVVQVRNEAETALLRSDEVVLKLEAARAALRSEALAESNGGRLERRRQKLDEGYERWMAERRENEIALAEGLASQDVRVRIRSARVLAKFRSPASLELLRASLRSGTSPQNEMAALSLGLRGDPSARADLEKASRVEHTALSVAAIRALQDLGQPESLPLLRSILETDSRERVRTAANFAIAMLNKRQRN